MNSLCIPRSGFALQRHQEFLKENLGKLDRVLLFHGLGSGKTCTAISLAAAYLQMSKQNKKIVVITPASLKENFYKEIMSACGNTQLQDFVNFKSMNVSVVKNASVVEKVKSICDDTKAAEQPNELIR